MPLLSLIMNTVWRESLAGRNFDEFALSEHLAEKSLVNR